MKKLKSILIASLLCVFATSTYAQQAESLEKSIQASFVKTEKQSMIVHVNKDTDAVVKVEIKDALGNLIYTKILKDNKFSGKFDFSNVADGTYTIVVRDNAGVVASKEVAIYTLREIAMR